MLTDKQKGILRLRIRGIMKPFNMYGMDVYVPPAIEAIVKEVESILTIKETRDG